MMKSQLIQKDAAVEERLRLVEERLQQHDELLNEVTIDLDRLEDKTSHLNDKQIQLSSNFEFLNERFEEERKLTSKVAEEVEKIKRSVQPSQILLFLGVMILIAFLIELLTKIKF